MVEHTSGVTQVKGSGVGYGDVLRFLAPRCEVAQSGSAPFSLILVEFDHYRLIEDRVGIRASFLASDHFRSVAAGALPAGAAVMAMGFDLLAIAVPSDPAHPVAGTAERIRKDVQEGRLIVGGHEKPILMTASVGIAECPGDTREPERLFIAAHQALRWAGGTGKNRVVEYSRIPAEDRILERVA